MTKDIMHMDKKRCAELMAQISVEGETILKEHVLTYDEILMHILVGELLTEPLFELLKENRDKDLILKYCDFIELMWREGDEYVVNVVDVTILERLSDDEAIWKQFGTYISEEFKKYINEEQIPNNLMMPHNYLV